MILGLDDLAETPNPPSIQTAITTKNMHKISLKPLQIKRYQLSKK